MVCKYLRLCQSDDDTRHSRVKRSVAGLPGCLLLQCCTLKVFSLQLHASILPNTFPFFFAACVLIFAIVCMGPWGDEALLWRFCDSRNLKAHQWPGQGQLVARAVWGRTGASVLVSSEYLVCIKSKQACSIRLLKAFSPLL